MVRRDWQVPRVKALRLERGLTIEALAAAADVNQGSVSLIERGIRGMSMSVAARLADALGVPPSDLYLDTRRSLSTSEALLHALIAAEMNPTIAKRMLARTPESLHGVILAAMTADDREEPCDPPTD